MAKKAEKKKNPDNITIVVSREAAQNLKVIAREIFNDYEEEHKKLQIRVPSSRVAIDYLIAMARYNGTEYMEKVKTDKNLWLAIGKPMQEED